MRAQRLQEAQAVSCDIRRAIWRHFALGAAAALMLLLTPGCDTVKYAACQTSSGLNDLFGGGEQSAQHYKDCGTGGQTARSYGGPASSDQLVTGPAKVTDAQKRLRDLGYDPGPVDGQMGAKTRAAIRAYQKDAGLAANGRLTEGLLEKIRAETPS